MILDTRSIADLREMKTYLQCDFLKSLAFKSNSSSQLSKGHLSLVLSGRYIGGAAWVTECHLPVQGHRSGFKSPISCPFTNYFTTLRFSFFSIKQALSMIPTSLCYYRDKTRIFMKFCILYLKSHSSPLIEVSFWLLLTTFQKAVWEISL